MGNSPKLLLHSLSLANLGVNPEQDFNPQMWTNHLPWVGKIPWRRAQQSIPVFLPAESHGQRTWGGYHPQGRKKSDTLSLFFSQTNHRPIHKKLEKVKSENKVVANIFLQLKSDTCLFLRVVLLVNFPGCSVVKPPNFQRRGCRCDPCSGTQDPTSHGAATKKKKKIFLKTCSVESLPFPLLIPIFHPEQISLLPMQL